MNVIKLSRADYVITLTSQGRNRLDSILDSFIDAMNQHEGGKVYLPEYRFALKLRDALVKPEGIKRAPASI